jgi:hypothetical protein
MSAKPVAMERVTKVYQRGNLLTCDFDQTIRAPSISHAEFGGQWIDILATVQLRVRHAGDTVYGRHFFLSRRAWLLLRRSWPSHGVAIYQDKDSNLVIASAGGPPCCGMPSGWIWLGVAPLAA